MTIITTEAMLVAPSIRTWSARRYDDKASATVAKAHDSEKKMGRYNKCLIDVKADSFLAVQRLASKAREWSYDHTLPWSQNGARILPAAMYLDFNTAMLGFKRQFESAVDAFLCDYPSLKEQAKKALNGLYNEEDYPSRSQLRSKYGIDIAYFPVPSADDFRVDMSQRDLDRIRSQITANVEAAVTEAMCELWTRLHEAVEKMAFALKEPERTFRDTLVSNLDDVLDVLPKLNLTNDPNLTRIGNEIRQSLNASADTLRNDKDVRSEQAKRADQIARSMAAFFQRPS